MAMDSAVMRPIFCNCCFLPFVRMLFTWSVANVPVAVPAGVPWASPCGRCTRCSCSMIEKVQVSVMGLEKNSNALTPGGVPSSIRKSTNQLHGEAVIWYQSHSGTEHKTQPLPVTNCYIAAAELARSKNKVSGPDSGTAYSPHLTVMMRQPHELFRCTQCSNTKHSRECVPAPALYKHHTAQPG